MQIRPISNVSFAGPGSKIIANRKALEESGRRMIQEAAEKKHPVEKEIYVENLSFFFEDMINSKTGKTGTTDYLKELSKKIEKDKLKNSMERV